MRVFALLPGILIGAIVVACSGNTADIPQPTASLTPSVTPSPITIESTPRCYVPGRLRGHYQPAWPPLHLSRLRPRLK